MSIKISNIVKACLWSYDVSKIDFSLSEHRALIIVNVLNHGTKEAINWLIKNFTKEEISNVISHTSVSEWNKKSLSLWSLIFGTRPSRISRFI